MTSTNAVTYVRVSTARQGQSGLGLADQRVALELYLQRSPYRVIAEFIEIESGKCMQRPKLLEALDLCRHKKATLVVAKLDRLSRNVAFVTRLMESGTKFVAVDMPEADTTFLQMAIVFAEWEGRKISERTKAALAVAKRRGQLLGFAMPSRRASQPAASAAGIATLRLRADNFAQNVQPIIRNIQASGVTSMKEVADILNSRGIPTARPGKWGCSGVRRILQRCVLNE